MSSGKWRPFCLCLNVLTWDTPCRVTDDAGHNGNGNIFRVTGPLCGEFTGHGEFPAQRPVTRSCDVFFDLRLNKRLNKQPWGWWFEMPSWSLWRQCNDSITHACSRHVTDVSLSSITTVTCCCHKNFSQWECSFLWKLHCHWLKDLR